ncbi:hypothetical protein SLOPH_781 [Spraguea lophii 42_110]|uniref:THAP-type domain-containing protein n=1 Tax=Spraguea lophii (strain 42_110) TaxID=1358809 RepID=S7WCF4_SPRLO|nr:hypothetical protein SLOPH_781 [Spraguea lophii 42_110]
MVLFLYLTLLNLISSTSNNNQRPYQPHHHDSTIQYTDNGITTYQQANNTQHPDYIYYDPKVRSNFLAKSHNNNTSNESFFHPNGIVNSTVPDNQQYHRHNTPANITNTYPLTPEGHHQNSSHEQRLSTNDYSANRYSFLPTQQSFNGNSHIIEPSNIYGTMAGTNQEVGRFVDHPVPLYANETLNSEVTLNPSLNSDRHIAKSSNANDYMHRKPSSSSAPSKSFSSDRKNRKIKPKISYTYWKSRMSIMKYSLQKDLSLDCSKLLCNNHFIRNIEFLKTIKKNLANEIKNPRTSNAENTYLENVISEYNCLKAIKTPKQKNTRASTRSLSNTSSTVANTLTNNKNDEDRDDNQVGFSNVDTSDQYNYDNDDLKTNPETSTDVKEDLKNKSLIVDKISNTKKDIQQDDKPLYTPDSLGDASYSVEENNINIKFFDYLKPSLDNTLSSDTDKELLSAINKELDETRNKNIKALLNDLSMQHCYSNIHDSTHKELVTSAVNPKFAIPAKTPRNSLSSDGN